MTFKDAINEYAAMAIVGANALQRLSETRTEGAQRAELSALLVEIVDRAERLKCVAASRVTMQPVR